MAEYLNHSMKHMMSRILEIRYTDLEEEKRLCQELLQWAEEQGDAYGKAFALTYLGDYHIAAGDEAGTGGCLTEAQDLLESDRSWDELRLRLYSLLGIYHDMRADEQSAIEYYLKAITVAESVNDPAGESVVLNNLAFSFQQHHCYKEALYYYKKAHTVQVSLKDSPIRTTLLGNLIDVSLVLHEFEEARAYVEECERAEEDPHRRNVLGYKNWCSYYSTVGEKEKALQYAELLLQNQDFVNEDKMTAFETYRTLCQNMMDLGDSVYAGRFLHAMEEVSKGGELDQVQPLERAIIRYALLFEPSESHAMAYRRFYNRNESFRSKVNQIITDAMKSSICLDQMMQQTERMLSEQEKLEKEVNLDELTGIYGRAFLAKLMEEWSYRPVGSSIGFIILDVDYFKEYNDFYGHLKGDMVLREIADCLREAGEEGIYPCRYGGDEFVCFCNGIAEEGMETYIDRVRAGLHTRSLPHIRSSCSDEVTLSIGSAVGDDNAETEIQLLFQLADQALYQSKRSGRNTHTRKRVNEI